MSVESYLLVIASLYGVGVLASVLEKVSAYRFSMRYEDISRSRETKREVKEIRIKVRQELPMSLAWPLEIWNLYKREGK